MAFKTFAPGVLTSSDVNTFLMRQAVITCTAATRPASPNEGMTIYETDTDTYKGYSGSAWEDILTAQAWRSFTPTINNWTAGNAVLDCDYIKVGRLVVARYQITLGSTSSPSGNLSVSVPVTAVAPTTRRVSVGNAYLWDVSPGAPYAGEFLLATANTIGITFKDVPGGGPAFAPVRHIDVQPTVPFTWTTSDEITGMAIYEAAA